MYLKKLLFIASLLLFYFSPFAQEMASFKLYNPSLDGEKQIATAVAKAKASNKHVFVQIGGNWCVWCARFHDFLGKDSAIAAFVETNFELVHLNYSPENRNKTVLEKMEFPQRFGFPVFIILDGEGRRLHTQNSAYLEEGRSYNKTAVMTFFRHWAPKALDPAGYKNY